MIADKTYQELAIENQNHFNQSKDTDASKYPSLYCVRQCMAELNPKFSVQPLPNNKGFKKT